MRHLHCFICEFCTVEPGVPRIHMCRSAVTSCVVKNLQHEHSATLRGYCLETWLVKQPGQSQLAGHSYGVQLHSALLLHRWGGSTKLACSGPFRHLHAWLIGVPRVEAAADFPKKGAAHWGKLVVAQTSTEREWKWVDMLSSCPDSCNLTGLFVGRCTPGEWGYCMVLLSITDTMNHRWGSKNIKGKRSRKIPQRD